MRAVEWILVCIVMRPAAIATLHYKALLPVHLFAVFSVFAIAMVCYQVPEGHHKSNYNS